MTHAAVAAALSPDWYAPILREWSPAAGRARAESQPQSTSLRAAAQAVNARFQYADETAAPPLPRHRPARACIRCLTGDLQKLKPSPESWCDLQSVCEWIQLRRANAG